MHPIRNIHETLYLCEEISKLKYGLVCYAPLTSFRTFNGGVVRSTTAWLVTTREHNHVIWIVSQHCNLEAAQIGMNFFLHAKCLEIVSSFQETYCVALIRKKEIPHGTKIVNSIANII